MTQSSGDMRREIAKAYLIPLACHRPRKRAPQYSRSGVFNSAAAAYWIARSSRATTMECEQRGRDVTIFYSLTSA